MFKKNILFTLLFINSAIACEPFKFQFGVGYGLSQTSLNIKSNNISYPNALNKDMRQKYKNLSGFLGLSKTTKDNIFYGVELGLEDTRTNQYLMISPLRNYTINYKLQTGLTTSLMGKLGYDFGHSIVYVSLGASLMKVKMSEKEKDKYEDLTVQKIDDLRLGLTTGIGYDYKITKNIMAGLKYNYTDFGKKTTHLQNCKFCFSTNPITHSLMFRITGQL